jgi:flavin reductase (DIM6/NTAB) family NADH-FMN oxidoreductase RutF
MHFDFSTLTAAERYKLMASAITPRPIAWLTTLSADGVRNAAPYSFFNMMSREPPLVAIGMMGRPDGTYQDSARNVLDTREFVINLVAEHDVQAMNMTCIDAPPEFDELTFADITVEPSVEVAPPRIASAPVSMECRVVETFQRGASIVVLGEVIHFHIADELVDPERLHVDALAMNLVARMHGAGWYTRSTDLFQLQRPTFADLARS